MTNKVQGWKMYPNPYRDEELVRMIAADKDCSVLERHLARRLERLLYQYDELEMDMANADTEIRQFQMELFPNGYTT